MSTAHNSPTQAPERPDSFRRFSLLVMSEAGVFEHALPAEGEVTIGRGEACAVRIEDPRASRVHAVLRIGDTLAVIDRESRNGTRIGDRAIVAGAAVPIDVGDMIGIGETVLTLKRLRVTTPPARAYSEATFREHVERELAPERSGATGFAVVHLQLEATRRAAVETTRASALAGDVTLAERIEATFAEVLRAGDLVGAFAPGAYVILLSRTPPDVAATIVTQLRAVLRARSVHALVGAACYPRDGSTLEALRGAAIEDSAEAHVPPARQLDQGALQRLAPHIDRIAAGRINVLILGETGVGKEVMARTLHVRSERALGPLVCVNCAALSESLLESELFGHEKGAFTGAVQAKVGLLESANGGTVFLDEVGEMPLALQAKLLRVVEQREVLRVGSLRPRAIDVRFLSATNRDLEAEMKRGRFRQDLFFRLNGISLTIPPLRERVEEIEALARAFAAQAAEQAGRSPPPISRPVLALLRRYPWPGNIRELRNVMERAVVLWTDGALTLDHMSPELKGAASPASPTTTLTDAQSERTTNQPFATGMTDRQRVIAALETCKGNQTHAARLLGIARQTLITRMEEYDLPRPRKK